MHQCLPFPPPSDPAGARTPHPLIVWGGRTDATFSVLGASASAVLGWGCVLGLAGPRSLLASARDWCSEATDASQAKLVIGVPNHLLQTGAGSRHTSFAYFAFCNAFGCVYCYTVGPLGAAHRPIDLQFLFYTNVGGTARPAHPDYPPALLANAKDLPLPLPLLPAAHGRPSRKERAFSRAPAAPFVYV